VTSRSHRYAERKSITWAEVAGERLCLLSPQTQSRRIIDALAAAADVQIQSGVASNSFITVLAHVAEGSWSCIVPRSIALMAGRSTDLVVIDFAEPGETPSVGLIVPRRGPLAPVAEELTKLVREIDFQATFGAGPHVHN
jgi:DNA-binding transcriptional LysR family regulator